jgi:hypothetical protein
MKKEEQPVPEIPVKKKDVLRTSQTLSFVSPKKAEKG